MTLKIRRARAEDAAALADLMNLAGEGIPAYLWEQLAAPDEDVMAFGARRVARTEGGFSYTNAYVAVRANDVAGMLLSYKLPDPYELGPLDDMPSVVHPLVELESLVPGSWYVNAVATAAVYRGRRIGHELMVFAEQLAGESRAAAVSLIVAEDNVPAMGLYRKLGYQVMERRPIIQYPGCRHTGDWVLMSKQLGAGV